MILPLLICFWPCATGTAMSRRDIGEGFLTIYTYPQPLKDIVIVDLPASSRRATIKGSKVRATLTEPFSIHGFFGDFYGLPDSCDTSISCKLKELPSN